MQFTVELPDDIAPQLIPAGCDPARTALEDMAVAAYRAHRLTEHQLATLLGMGRYQLDGFLKQRGVWFDISIDEIERELAVGRELWQKRSNERESSAGQ